MHMPGVTLPTRDMQAGKLNMCMQISHITPNSLGVACICSSHAQVCCNMATAAL
jgi:hypothetical protein